MPLTKQQELDAAFARNQAGTASVEDMKNIAYAKRTMGYQPTAPTTPTVKQIYSDLPTATTTPTTPATVADRLNLPTTNPNDQYNKTLTEYENAFNTNFAVDEDKLRQDTLSQFQQQIDATNRVYADMLAREQRASQGRTGQDTAIQARRGMLGSDFGAAQSAGVSQTNKELENAVENQRALAINAIMTQARDAGTARIENERKLKKEGLEARLAYYKSAAERRQTNASDAAKTLIAQGLDLSALSPLELSRLTQYYGVDADDIKYAYATASEQQKQATQEAQDAQTKRGLEIEKLRKESLLVVPAGQSVYDVDGNYIGTAPSKDDDKPLIVPAGSTLYSKTGEILGTAPKTPTARVGGVGTVSVGTTGDLSVVAKTVYENPSLLNNYTPTKRGQILDELSNAGVDMTRFTLNNPSGTQREQIAQYDDLVRQANEAQDILVNSKLNTGPLATPVKSAKTLLGVGDNKDFIDYNSVISNMSSTLLRMRSGAAVTPQEYERIRGFIPLLGEDESTATQKIVQFYQELEKARQNFINRATQSPYTITQTTSAEEDPLGILN